MKFYFLIFLPILVCIQGCQQPKETVRETVVVSDRSQQTGGTDQVGGGNGIDGVPLDAFISNVEKSQGYITKIEPLIKQLSQTFPELAGDFYHLSHQRDWYFVPGKLDSISQNILGSYAPTDQIALQDTNKVWIDKLQFEKMNLENQGILILHEMIMGVQIIQFKHKQDRCIAKASVFIFEKDGQILFQNEKSKCRKTYPILNGTNNEKFDAHTIPYDAIRRVVSILNHADPDIEEIKALFKNSGIRDYTID